MFKLFLLVAFLGGWTLAASALYVVRTPGSLAGVSLLTKNELALEDTFLDVRDWKDADIDKHKAFVARVKDSSHPEILAHVLSPGAAQPESPLAAMKVGTQVLAKLVAGTR